MKIVQISKDGVFPVFPTKEDYYWAFTHGEKGRGRWRVDIPLGMKDFPLDTPVDEHQHYKLIPLHKKDKQDQDRYLLGSGGDDNTYLVLLSLSPGFRGGASYSIDGAARLLCCGRQAQGAAGAMGGAPCPVIHVTGPCRLAWTRTGRLYGTPADWVAAFDGKAWSVMTADQADALAAMA